MAKLAELHTDKKCKIILEKKNTYILLPSVKIESGIFPLSMLPLKNLFKATHTSISYVPEHGDSEVSSS